MTDDDAPRHRPGTAGHERAQARTIGLMLLAVFGLVLVVSAIGVFCLLMAEPLGACLVETVSPF